MESRPAADCALFSGCIPACIIARCATQLCKTYLQPFVLRFSCNARGTLCPVLLHRSVLPFAKGIFHLLTALETRIPVVQRQAMYTEATFGLDTICRGMEAGKAPEAAIAFEQLRFFYPQLWLQAALDKENILQMYLAEDFSSMKPSFRRSAYIFSMALIPVLQPTGNKFKA